MHPRREFKRKGTNSALRSCTYDDTGFFGQRAGAGDGDTSSGVYGRDRTRRERRERSDLAGFCAQPQIVARRSEILFTDQTGQGSVQYGVYVRKKDGSPAVRIGENGFGSDITPDGKFALVINADDRQMRIQIVPVGTGDKKILHWEGVQPIWAEWFPEGEHILLFASSPPGNPSGIYVTDRKGTPPKLIVEGPSDARAYRRTGRG